MLYSPGAVEYSASDYQHIKPVKSPENFPSICVSKSSHQRPKSQYSVLNNEHLYSRHTFFENLSEASYDPFRASREPIVNASNNYMNVTVHRSSSSGSKKLNPRLSSSRKPSSLRVEALRKTSREGSELSAASTLTRGLPSRRISSSHRSSMSRTSMHSGQWLSSPPIAVIRPSNVHKRAVNFSHFRKSSTTGGLPSRAGPDRVARMPDQRPHLHQMRHSSGGNLTVPSSSPQHEVIAPVACEKGNALFVQPTPRTKKMKDIEHEARKVSVELEKVCEEAFFRSSITLSNRSSMTERPNSFSTPPSSVSNRSEQVRSKLHFTDKSTPVDRPLPTIPVSASSSSAETPRTFTARELAEVRDRLARTYAEKGVSSEKAFHDLLNQLDNLFPFDARRSTDGTRSSSAPCSSHPSSRYSPDTNNLLHVIPEEGRFADAEVEISHHERKNPSRRVATAPWSRRYDFSVDTTNNPTVRFVPPSSPPSPPSPTPVAPLNIRKRSNNNNATYKTRSESEAETASQGKFRSNFFSFSRSDLSKRTDDSSDQIESATPTRPSTQPLWWKHDEQRQPKAENVKTRRDLSYTDDRYTRRKERYEREQRELQKLRDLEKQRKLQRQRELERQRQEQAASNSSQEHATIESERTKGGFFSFFKKKPTSTHVYELKGTSAWSLFLCACI